MLTIMNYFYKNKLAKPAEHKVLNINEDSKMVLTDNSILYEGDTYDTSSS